MLRFPPLGGAAFSLCWVVLLRLLLPFGCCCQAACRTAHCTTGWPVGISTTYLVSKHDMIVLVMLCLLVPLWIQRIFWLSRLSRILTFSLFQLSCLLAFPAFPLSEFMFHRLNCNGTGFHTGPSSMCGHLPSATTSIRSRKVWKGHSPWGLFLLLSLP